MNLYYYYYYLVCSATWWKNGRNTHLKEIFNCDHEHLIPPEYLLAFYRGVSFLNWSIQKLSFTGLSFGYWVIEPQNHKRWNFWNIFLSQSIIWMCQGGSWWSRCYDDSLLGIHCSKIWFFERSHIYQWQWWPHNHCTWYHISANRE